MLYREIMAVCSEIHTKHINTLCGQNVELLNVKLAVLVICVLLYALVFAHAHTHTHTHIVCKCTYLWVTVSANIACDAPWFCPQGWLVWFPPLRSIQGPAAAHCNGCVNRTAGSLLCRLANKLVQYH